jgi:hypothetical protein
MMKLRKLIAGLFWIIDAVLLIGLCAVGAVCALRKPVMRAETPAVKIDVALPELPTIEPEDPDEDEKIFAAIMAKCQVVEDCQIVGYAPELIEGWDPSYRNEFGLYLTASGTWVAPGFCVATDPDVIPTGATVIIEGRVYVAADRGVRGKVIDVMMTPEEALVYGCHTANVYWCLEGDANE